MTKEGVMIVRSYEGMPEEGRWNLDQMNGVKVSPLEPVPGTGRIEFKSSIGEGWKRVRRDRRERIKVGEDLHYEARMQGRHRSESRQLCTARGAGTG